MKKWAKVFVLLGILVIGLSFGLAGCSSASSITNSSEEIIYNGNVAASVDGYVFYGNSIVDIDEITDSSTYKSYASISNLARVNGNNITQTSKDYSPSNVDNISTEVTAYDNSFMFVLGDYVFYATPYTQERQDSDGGVANYYNYTTFYRSKLDGSNKKSIYSTSAEISEVEVLKDPNSGTYYLVMLSGTNLVSINLSSLNAVTIAEDVTSVAMPETYNSSLSGSSLDFNGLIYYTATPEDAVGNTNTGVYSVSLSGDEKNSYNAGTTTISFLDRVGDVLFFSETIGSQTYVFMLDVSNGSFATTTTSGALFATDSTLSDFYRVTNPNTGVELGYVFMFGSNLAYISVKDLQSSSSSSPVFKTISHSGTISISADGSTLSDFEIVAISGRTIYLATTTGIYSVSLSNSLFSADTTSSNPVSLTATTIVTMSAIYDGNYFAFDGTYIYYYAQLEELAIDEDDDEDDDDEGETEDEEETDENYYMYRVKASGKGSYQLLGVTTISSRRTTN